MENRDLITRAAAIDALTDTNLKRNVDSLCDGDMNRARRAAQRVIAQLPAVDAELEQQGYVRVTRCRDCKRWGYDLDLAPIGKCTCLNSLLWTKPDDYCSRGERADAPTCGPDYCELEDGDE